MLAKNGTAAPITPMPPTTLVATRRRRRFPFWTPESAMRTIPTGEVQKKRYLNEKVMAITALDR